MTNTSTQRRRRILFCIAILVALGLTTTTLLATNNTARASNYSAPIQTSSNTATVPIHFTGFSGSMTTSWQGTRLITNISYSVNPAVVADIWGTGMQLLILSGTYSYGQVRSFVRDVRGQLEFIHYNVVSAMSLPYWENHTTTADWSTHANFGVTDYTIVLFLDFNMEAYLAVKNVASPAVPLPPDPVLTGFTFMGWYLDSTFTQPLGATIVLQDTILHARFEAIVYTIIYNLNGGVLADQPTSFTIESDTITIPTPTREGHYFRGWHDNPSFSGVAIVQIEAGTIGNVVLYARWEIQRFTITFVVRGEEHHSIVVDWGTILAPSAVSFVNTLTGTPARLYGDANLSSFFDFCSAGITNDMTVFTNDTVAIFVAITYNVLGEKTTHLVPHGEFMRMLPTAYRTGFVFSGWYTDNIFSQRVMPNDRLTTNTTIYARLVPISEMDPSEANNWLANNWWVIALIVAGLIVIGGIGYGIKKKVKGS